MPGRLPNNGSVSGSEESSIWRDLRSGKAGWPLRLGLSAVATLGGISLIALGTGVFDAAGGLSDGAVVLVASGAAMAWAAALAAIWWRFRKWAPVLRTLLMIAGVWIVALPTTVVLERTIQNSDGLMVGAVFAAIAATAGLLVMLAYRTASGRAVRDPRGAVRVNCPRCGYSMVGLCSSTCPECGTTFTIDQIIGGQDYAAPTEPDVVARLPVAAGHSGDEGRL